MPEIDRSELIAIRADLYRLAERAAGWSGAAEPATYQELFALCERLLSATGDKLSLRK